ncbi:thiamine pyrophosphate-binding protein [Nocardia sp. bgisy134]|uniref:thiamine pyrophosphate-binding protein n=1 Tax=Nocardia sp. bgisy134 TaxID=3413789 RepID=UPI003D75C8E8
MISTSALTGEQTVSDHVAQWLCDHDIDHLYTLPGGMIAALLDAVHRSGRTRIVTLHHEQAVAFAADGEARYNGTPAVALATAGPGATNMLTAVASAYLDSVPVLFLVGQVQSYLLKGARPVRQYGFQECDIVAMAEPVTKASWRAKTAEEIPALLDGAHALAVEGRPGPVLIELPADLQTQPVSRQARFDRIAEAAGEPFADADAVAGLLDAFTAAERPLVLLGGGIHAARAVRACRELLRVLGAPVAASITALDVLPAGDPLRLGMIGMYGNRWVNTAVGDADFLLVLGSKLDFGTLGADVGAITRAQTVFQVDRDAGEMQRVRTARTIVADLGEFLDVAVFLARQRAFPGRAEWIGRIDALRRRYPDTEELAGCAGINPNVLVRQLSSVSAEAGAFVVDEGQHLWWTCQSIQPRAGQRFLPALGLGPCGWAFPAAIGVACTTGRPVVLIAGDGAFQFNIQELQTVVRYRLPVKIVVVDNGCHGSVRQLQEQAFAGRYPSTVEGYDAPDFARVAAAYGMAARTIGEPGEVESALAWLWGEDGPRLLHVRIAQELNVYPNVPFGAPITVMESRPQEDR